MKRLRYCETVAGIFTMISTAIDTCSDTNHNRLLFSKKRDEKQTKKAKRLAYREPGPTKL